jgi:hypothetical protein
MVSRKTSLPFVFGGEGLGEVGMGVEKLVNHGLVDGPGSAYFTVLVIFC